MIAERRARVLTAMADAGFDALILGREPNARYVSGARRLPLTGARAFAPGCVLTASGEVHLLSTSDDGIPVDVPFERLYAITWNPANLMARLARIPALTTARRIGVDGLTLLMESLLRGTFPDADLADGQSLMLEVRRRKLPEEVESIRRAVALAARALDDVIAVAQPGIRERDLLAQFEQRICELGTTTPSFEGTFGHTFPSDGVLVAGDRVVLDVGVLLDGYEGGLGRTIVCGETAASSNPADELFVSLLTALRPGATAADVWTVLDAAGAARPSAPVVHGVGLGFEAPVFGDDEDAIAAGMTLSVRAEVDGWVRREIVVVGADRAEVVSA